MTHDKEIKPVRHQGQHLHAEPKRAYTTEESLPIPHEFPGLQCQNKFKKEIKENTCKLSS